MYAKVKFEKSKKLSNRKIAQKYGIFRWAVGKILKEGSPPGYRRKKAYARPVLDGYTDFIDEILESDRFVHR